MLLLLAGWDNRMLVHADEAPFGLQWGMAKEDVEGMHIRLCCRQLGKWGERYEVNPRDFGKLPKTLGDEEKIYLYFGNDNQLLRVYVAVTKIDGKNRYNQIRLLLGKRYDVLKACDWTASSDCNGYKAFTAYQKGEVDVFVGFEENLTYRDKIFITFVNTTLYKGDKDSQNPF